MTFGSFSHDRNIPKMLILLPEHCNTSPSSAFYFTASHIQTQVYVTGIVTMWWSPTPTTLTLPQILPKSPRYPPQRHLHTLSSWWNAQPPTEFGNQKPWSKLRICSTPQTVYLDSWESLQSPASSSTCNSSSSSSSLAMMSRWLWRILQVWWSEQGILGIMGALVALTRGWWASGRRSKRAGGIDGRRAPRDSCRAAGALWWWTERKRRFWKAF